MKKYFILAAAALTLAACSNDESNNTVNDNVIRLSSSVGVVTRASSNIYPKDSHFSDGTTVKVQLTADDGSVTYSAIDYTDDGSGTLTGESTQYYPANGTAVSGYAYYPSDASTASNGFVLGDQDDDTDYKKYDLMRATLTNITQNSNAAARTLTFNHLLSKITVTLVKGTAETSELDAATITLKDVMVKGTFDYDNLNTVLSESGASNATLQTTYYCSSTEYDTERIWTLSNTGTLTLGLTKKNTSGRFWWRCVFAF